MRKVFVVLVAIMTLGMYTPTTLLEIEAEDNKNSLSSKADVDQAELSPTEQTLETYETVLVEDSEPDYLSELQEQAKVQSLLKFGPRIAEQVEDEFSAVILPKMEAVLEQLAIGSRRRCSPLLRHHRKTFKRLRRANFSCYRS